MIRSWIKRLVVAGAAMSFIAVGVPAPAPASAAVVTPMSTCNTQYCGGVVRNNSSGLIYVANNWCWSNQYTYYGNTLPCATTWNSYAPNSYTLLGHPDTTANYYYYYDTDAFRVDAGCQITAWDGGTLTYDNRYSSSPMWVKINNMQDINITVACARSISATRSRCHPCTATLP